MWKMEFHPQKCQILRITNKRKITQGNYFIHNIPLQQTNTAKYLGVIIDSTLKWKDQYNTIIKKANNVLAFLNRNIKDCPDNVKASCYKTLVRPILEYGCAVWDPHFKVDIENIEKVQKRAARFITGNYVYEPGNTKINMQKLNLKSLEERRAALKLHLFFKSQQNLIDLPNDILTHNTNPTRRGNSGYVIPISNVDSHLYSFYPNSIRLWNALPSTVRNYHNVDSFSNELHKLTLRPTW